MKMITDRYLPTSSHYIVRLYSNHNYIAGSSVTIVDGVVLGVVIIIVVMAVLVNVYFRKKAAKTATIS